jgi:hypothetical protein
MAAAICNLKNTNPRGLYQNHFSLLEELMSKGVGNPNLLKIQNYNLGKTLMETTD